MNISGSKLNFKTKNMKYCYVFFKNIESVYISGDHYKFYNCNYIHSIKII